MKSAVDHMISDELSGITHNTNTGEIEVNANAMDLNLAKIKN